MHLGIRKLFFLIALLLFGTITFAEPWLSNRYAQNCSACHSPSRRNVATRDRRCTLACQGCHVNPNGGGIRNQYGVWNQQRWLRSYKLPKNKYVDFDQAGTPAPLKYQKYANQPHGNSIPNEDSNNLKNDKNTKPTRPRNPNAADDEDVRLGPSLIVAEGVDYNEKDFDKSDRQEHITVYNKKEFLERLTRDDPYRKERELSSYVGGDFRYFYLDGKWDRDNSASTAEYNGTFNAMNFDIGARIRPIKEKFSFVIEQRFRNAPTPSKLNGAPNDDSESSFEKVFQQSQVRSAYFFLDDMPYASYAMFGLYRPMFGHTTPDHTTLLNHIITADNEINPVDPINDYDQYHSSSATAVNKAFSIGASPNVPFFNLHYIMPADDQNLSQDKGFAANLGGRFVTMGASFMLSYWKTKRLSSFTGNELNSTMYGLTAGATYKNLILNIDYTTVDREFQPGRSDKGSVTTLEGKVRIFREVYGVVNVAKSNVARNLKEGSASEIMYGIKTFFIAGSELEILKIDRRDTDKDATDSTAADRTTNFNLLQAQLHLYF